MSAVTSSLGSAWNSSQVQLTGSAPPSIENIHCSSGVCGVGPADSTGKSPTRCCPGGIRSEGPSLWRPWKPREISGIPRLSQLAASPATVGGTPSKARRSRRVAAGVGVTGEALRRLASRRRLPAAQHRVERNGGEEDDAGGDELDCVGVADEVDSVGDHADDQAAEERAADAATAAEEADATDHGRGDRVEQNGAAAGAFETDAVEARGEDDPTHGCHRAGDHEDQDSDQLDVDPSPARGFGVAADGVDVAAEGRPAGHVSAKHDEEDDDQPDERKTGPGFRLVTEQHRRERHTSEEGDPDDEEKEVAGWEARSQAAEIRAEAGGRKCRCEDDCDDPAGVLGQDVVRDVVDLNVLDTDHALRTENLQDQALTDEQPRKRDHERGDADEGDDRSLNQPDHQAGQDREAECDKTRVLVAGPRLLEIGDGHAPEPADKADREVDLADQEYEDDPDRDHGHAGHLSNQVLEVDGAEEEARLRVEEERDRDDSDDHRQAAYVARPDSRPAGA